MEKSQKPWQVQVQGQIYEAELEELKQWIVEGSVLASDNVRRGDLRWLPAEKVPALLDFFSADKNAAAPVVSDDNFQASGGEISSDARSDSNGFSAAPLPAAAVTDSAAADNFSRDEQPVVVKPNKEFCCQHTEKPTKYACDICENYFCKECPKSFGGSVKLCPLCGSLCREISEAVNAQNQIGAIHKPYSQMDEPTLPKENGDLKISGIQKSLVCSLKHYKKSFYQMIRRDPSSR